MDQQDVQHRQTLNKDDTMESKLEYVVGDVVWAKLMGCPFWPAIVTYDPVSKLFFKGKNKMFALHVRFCNYYGQRSWVKTIEKYCSKQDFLSKHPDCMVSLKKSKKEMISWHAAVEEADRLMTLNREERLLRFCTIYKLDFSKELNINGPSDDPAPQNTNLNSNGVFHNEAAPVIIRNENIQNNDTTDGNESDDSDYSAANALEIADLLIQKYGFSQNDEKPENDELDFEKLEISRCNYRVPLELKKRISAFEERLERENRELQIQKQKEDELKRCLRY